MFPTFDNTYARLGDGFYARVAPAPVPAPRVVRFNAALAELLGFDSEALSGELGAQVLSGNHILEGSDPMALAYAGHQFGHFVPQLGDGRALLLGEVVGRDGRRRDIQLKGSGRTPFSRGGDGKAALGPVLRETIVGEAMFALGIPTTRALAALTTGERVWRDTPLPGAIFVRVAASHLRIGTFQYFAARRERDALARLTSYALERHYPEATGAGNDALALLEHVSRAQADLVALWLGVGFVHGVMNTDNTTISGETIDYGPCAFLDEYDPAKKFSSIDHGGRYAFMNQPSIMQWNLARLAEALLSEIDEVESRAIEKAVGVLDRFPGIFRKAHERVLRGKLGLTTEEEVDGAFAAGLLSQLATHRVDYTLFFRSLCDSAADPANDAKAAALFPDPQVFALWAETWRARTAREPVTAEVRAEGMRAKNPAHIPRNHRVEEAIAAAVSQGDYGPFERLMEAVARPFATDPQMANLALPPKPEERVTATFCGT